jgi:mannose-6-phosphate isomerase class I
MRTPNYDCFPTIDGEGTEHDVRRGWDAIAAHLGEMLSASRSSKHAPLLIVECYAGVFQDEIVSALRSKISAALWIDSGSTFLPPGEIDRLVAPYLGGDDPIFGLLSPLELEQFFSVPRLNAARSEIARANCPVIIVGPGASIIAPRPDIFVYADLARWEAQGRQRRDRASNLGVENRTQPASLQYKRSFFVDWRVCDRLKKRSMNRWDYFLDTNVPHDPKLVTATAFRRTLTACTTHPFRLVPFFDPGPWGGQWMREVCDLGPRERNYAWCFDCVPEENSLLIKFGDVRVEAPSIDLIFAEPRALLGEPVYGRFGREFPIRFDFLDTMGGGNLSLQVHPLTEYIQERFGMPYTQDESYYILDCAPEAEVYLGRKKGVELDEMLDALERAQQGGESFDADRFIARFPARKHDHFLIPAGTLHCSGKNCMVLEISATPYIFTFKLWDWNRLGLDGRPRPINIERGKANIQWDRDEDYVASRLINQTQQLTSGEGWREERTGLHEAQFIETRRHWFSGIAPHDTGGEMGGSVNVLNLVSGEEAVVESPTEAFAPFVVHYAETFIVPAAVGEYRIRPIGRSAGAECATIKAFVRCRG